VSPVLEIYPPANCSPPPLRGLRKAATPYVCISGDSGDTGPCVVLDAIEAVPGFLTVPGNFRGQHRGSPWPPTRPTADPGGHRRPSRPARPASWPSAWWERTASRYPPGHPRGQPPSRSWPVSPVTARFGSFRLISAEPVWSFAKGALRVGIPLPHWRSSLRDRGHGWGEHPGAWWPFSRAKPPLVLTLSPHFISRHSFFVLSWRIFGRGLSPPLSLGGVRCEGLAAPSATYGRGLSVFDP